MKKIITTLLFFGALVLPLQADMLRLEAGLGSWNSAPAGTIEGTNVSNGFDGIDTLNEKKDSNIYGWVMLKHFIPVISNFRVEYLDMTSNGRASGDLFGLTINGLADTQIDMTQIELIPYYNLLDNTFWITFDLGVAIKFIDLEYRVEPTSFLMQEYYTTESLTLPFAYVRSRVEIPFTDLGLEADLKYLEYDNNVLYDVRAKIDYTFDISPVIQPAIELGYRKQVYETDETKDIILDLDFSGVYAGVMLRF